ncbi:MAG: DNA mismatch repair endonuclease MutL [Lachnospiraceae bacterium]|nr:DNA mismatch repair endonuclease MutL [Lachnospiraceae bacterium]
MSKIQLLDSATIDKIAAGEVVERPSSVVKELVENAIDAGATVVTVEIKDGGISFIRVTDNGKGIPAEQVRDAFLRHATSKIRTSEDLNKIQSLGFRGEALSSIAAVAQVEMMTKQKESLMGVQVCMEGGREISYSQVGVPDGTTILVKNLFFNTPARRKFLKTPATEGSYIADLCEHLAMSKPEVAFRFIANNQVKFHTSGNGELREIVYRIFGKDFIRQLIPVDAEWNGLSIKGYLGKPTLNRSNRNFENYFINGRYVKSNFLYKAVEEGYKQYLMQHKFPFAVLYFTMDTEKVDVNVHPTKMDIRITDSQCYFEFISNTISNILKNQEMIPEMELEKKTQEVIKSDITPRNLVPEPFEQKRMEQYKVKEDFSYITNRLFGEDCIEENSTSMSSVAENNKVTHIVHENENISLHTKDNTNQNILDAEVIIQNTDVISQLNLFEEKILKQENKNKFEILGQIFHTYWLVRYEDKLLFVDQHAAHEKIKFEKLMSSFKEKHIVSQSLQPPLILHLTQKEEAVLEEFRTYFEAFGFVWEEFGSHSIAMREMPLELYGKSEKRFFEEILDELVEEGCKGTPEVVQEKIASMACKSAVKGNQNMTKYEMEDLLLQLFELENPYHCPHGRPTIISMSKTELEKKFKRIV